MCRGLILLLPRGGEGRLKDSVTENSNDTRGNYLCANIPVQVKGVGVREGCPKLCPHFLETEATKK